jgi:hypothetical protein
MSRTLERGDVFFFYRLRVGLEEAHEPGDVQRLFLLLKPDRRSLFRRVIVGRKRLPDPLTHERVWAFVAEVAHRLSEARDDIGPAVYETRTRGIRVEPPARPAGEGRYALVDHGGHTHLAYALELPPEPGDVQRALGIEREASYIVAVRSPDAPAPPGAGLPPQRRAQLPPELTERFGGRRFAPVDPPEMLDYEGIELVMIGASVDVDAELGIDLDAHAERLETADIFRKLRIRPEQVPTEPLETGRWA